MVSSAKQRWRPSKRHFALSLAIFAFGRGIMCSEIIRELPRKGKVLLDGTTAHLLTKIVEKELLWGSISLFCDSRIQRRPEWQTRRIKQTQSDGFKLHQDVHTPSDCSIAGGASDAAIAKTVEELVAKVVARLEKHVVFEQFFIWNNVWLNPGSQSQGGCWRGASPVKFCKVMLWEIPVCEDHGPSSMPCCKLCNLKRGHHVQSCLFWKRSVGTSCLTRCWEAKG